jgi:hypothetical protein
MKLNRPTKYFEIPNENEGRQGKKHLFSLPAWNSLTARIIVLVIRDVVGNAFVAMVVPHAKIQSQA